MVEPIQPGDLGALKPDRLAAASNYAALAALIEHTRQDPPANAVQALFGACGDPDAFRWAWSLAQKKFDLWRHVDAFPQSIAVPEELQEPVQEFVLRPAPKGGPVKPDVARPKFMRGLDPTGSLGLRIAREAFNRDSPPTDDVRQVALDFLGGSSDPADRAVVFDQTQEIRPDKRILALLRLTTPYSADEVDQLLSVLQELTRRPVEAGDWKPAATLAARLPIDRLADFLVPSWTRSGNKQELIQAGLLSRLGPDNVCALLDEKPGDETAQLVLSQAGGQLGTDDAGIRFGVWAHEKYPASQLRELRGRYTQRLASKATPEDKRSTALKGLFAFVFATDDIEAAAALVDHLTPNDELLPTDTQIDEAVAFRLGQLAGYALARADFTDRVVATLQTTPTELRSRVFAGLAASDALGQVELAPRLMFELLHDDGSIAAVAAAGWGDLLVNETNDAPQPAIKVLLAAATELSSTQVVELTQHVSWTTYDGETYRQVVAALMGHPPALFNQVDRAVRSLEGPEADAISASTLCDLLDHARDAGLRDQLEEATTHCVEVLLEHPDDEVITRACAWVRALDLDVPQAGSESADRARRVVKIDDARGGQHQELHALRRDLGAKFAALAQDSTQKATERRRHLELTVEIDPTAARAAAFQLATATTNSLRDAAAETLCTTPPSGEDHDALQELVANEPHKPIGSRLEAALHQVYSGSIGTALRNLAELVGAPSDQWDPGVLIPEGRFNERFRVWIDTARARSGNTGDPGTFIEAAINLTDLMVDVAVLEGSKINELNLKTEQLEGIRANSEPRPQTGELLARQNLHKPFPWFAQCQALRNFRTSHPSPLGSTDPIRLKEDDFTAARKLFEQVTLGWFESMWAIRNKAHDSSS
jgi:hypothetical protein